MTDQKNKIIYGKREYQVRIELLSMDQQCRWTLQNSEKHHRISLLPLVTNSNNSVKP